MSHLAFRIWGIVLCSAVAFAVPELDREIVLVPHVGPAKEDAAIAQWQQKAADEKATSATFEQLGWAYIAKARRSLDAGFYKLAEKTAEVAQAQFGASAGMQLLRGHVWHNLHRFREAEGVARALVADYPAPAAYALLSDVLIEQGKLVEGIAVLQRLTDLKPGAEAFTRIAHVRWLKGDLAGAITAMEMAARATSADDTEANAWMLTRLSAFRLQAGDTPRALALADEACRRADDFPAALLARGRALLASEKSAEAVEALTRAAKLNPLPEYQWWLADALRASGRGAEATKVEAQLWARGAAGDPRTFALFLATRGEDPATAVRLAREELAQRQDVFSHDALAWALARQGDLQGAQAAMRAALAEKTRDARLFLHAGEIARLGGRLTEAAASFRQAQDTVNTLTPSERALLNRRSAELSSSLVTTQP